MRLCTCLTLWNRIINFYYVYMLIYQKEFLRAKVIWDDVYYIHHFFFSMKNNLRSLVNAQGAVHMMTQIHSMAAIIMSFSFYRWSKPDRWHLHIESASVSRKHPQCMLNFIQKKYLQHGCFHSTLIFSPDLGLCSQKSKALVAWPLGML